MATNGFFVFFFLENSTYVYYFLQRFSTLPDTVKRKMKTAFLSYFFFQILNVKIDYQHTNLHVEIKIIQSTRHYKDYQEIKEGTSWGRLLLLLLLFLSLLLLLFF